MPKTSGRKSARPVSSMQNESPTKGGGRKLANQTSAAQLQVYMKPEYVDFTKRLAPKNPQNIRPKRMNIQQTLR